WRQRRVSAFARPPRLSRAGGRQRRRERRAYRHARRRRDCERDGVEGEGARGCRGRPRGRGVGTSIPRRRSDAELRQRFEPQKDLENGGKTSEKGGNRQVPPFFCKDQRRQSERQEDEHEGSAGACHLHPIPHGICVSEEKDDEKDEEGGFESGR